MNDRKKTILVVDDDLEIAESVRTALTSNGYEVRSARDGNQGLAMIEQNLPDMIILDMMMPKRSGFLVLETVRQNFSSLPHVIMITANEGNRHREYAEQLGVDAYLRKPFPMDMLLGTVKRIFEQK